MTDFPLSGGFQGQRQPWGICGAADWKGDRMIKKKPSSSLLCVLEKEREGGRKSNQYTGALPFQNNVSQAIWDGEGSIYDDKVDLK